MTAIEQAEQVADATWAAAERREQAQQSWGFTYTPVPVQAERDRHLWLKVAGGALLIAALFAGTVIFAAALMPRN